MRLQNVPVGPYMSLFHRGASPVQNRFEYARTESLQTFSPATNTIVHPRATHTELRQRAGRIWNPSELRVCTPCATVNQQVPHMPICINTAILCLECGVFGAAKMDLTLCGTR